MEKRTSTKKKKQIFDKNEVESVSNETLPTTPDKKQTSFLHSYIRSYSKTGIESTTLDYFWKIDQFKRFYEIINTLNSPLFPENGPYMIQMNITRKSDSLITTIQFYIRTNTAFIGSCTVTAMHPSDSVILSKSISGHITDMTLLIEILDLTHIYTDTFILQCKFEIYHKLINSIIHMNLSPSIKNMKSEDTIFSEFEFDNKNGNSDSIKFIVGNEHYIVPKKLLCATNSSYFINICLTHEEKEKDITNELMSSELQAFKQLLLFIITGSMEQHDYDMLKNLLTIADKYDVLLLKIICEHYLLRCITVENAIELIQLAFSSNAKFLKTHTVTFIKFHIKEIIGTQEFQNLSQKDLSELMELFEKCEILEINTDFFLDSFVG